MIFDLDASYFISQILTFALNFVGPFQEKQYKRKASERKISKEKWPRKFPKPPTIRVFHQNGCKHRQNTQHT